MQPSVRAELVEAGTGGCIGWEFSVHPSTRPLVLSVVEGAGRTENFIGKLLSGRDSVLLHHPPLRTAHTSFPVCGSSLYKPRFTGAGSYFLFTAVHLSMTFRMYYHEVEYITFSAVRLTLEVMEIPSCFLCNLFGAVRAYSLLHIPKKKQFVLSSETFFHLQAKPVFEILFPCRIKRMCFCFYLDVSANWRITGINQLDHLHVSILSFNQRAKHPIAESFASKISVLYPSTWFIWMSSTSPLPKHFPDEMIHL